MSAFAGGDVVLGAPCAAGAGSAAVAELLWFTYRCGFEELAPYGFTDDAGWGCMLRSAQMLLGNALTRNGAAPRLATAALFADAPGDSAPFGLHNFAKCGLRYDVLPGEWYGPGVACHVLRDLVDWRRNAPGGPALRVAVRTPERRCPPRARGDAMTQSRRDAAAEDPAPAPEDAAPLDVDGADPLLRPPPERARARGGGERARAAAASGAPPRRRLGRRAPRGRPRAALFFPGLAARDGGADVYGLDPHTVQPALAVGDDGALRPGAAASVAPRDAKKLAADALDPSLALAFYCADRDDFLDFVGRARALPGAPLFEVVDAAPRRGGACFDDDDDDDASGGGGGDDEDDWEVV
ncbi:cysteine protease [Aureococcus anophagefferens]|uniref:Cysteine protease n=1 Tax=Aureococcus anophagefferens TaxID=44056 RepID=A0ABR1GED1_AURAN